MRKIYILKILDLIWEYYRFEFKVGDYDKKNKT